VRVTRPARKIPPFPFYRVQAVLIAGERDVMHLPERKREKERQRLLVTGTRHPTRLLLMRSRIQSYFSRLFFLEFFYSASPLPRALPFLLIISRTQLTFRNNCVFFLRKHVIFGIFIYVIDRIFSERSWYGTNIPKCKNKKIKGTLRFC